MSYFPISSHFRLGKKVSILIERNKDHAWDMVVPGFDAAPSHHVHVAPERERKKGKTVVPRAAPKPVVRKDDE